MARAPPAPPLKWPPGEAGVSPSIEASIPFPARVAVLPDVEASAVEHRPIDSQDGVRGIALTLECDEATTLASPIGGAQDLGRPHRTAD